MGLAAVVDPPRPLRKPPPPPPKIDALPEVAAPKGELLLLLPKTDPLDVAVAVGPPKRELLVAGSLATLDPKMDGCDVVAAPPPNSEPVEGATAAAAAPPPKIEPVPVEGVPALNSPPTGLVTTPPPPNIEPASLVVDLPAVPPKIELLPAAVGTMAPEDVLVAVEAVGWDPNAETEDAPPNSDWLLPPNIPPVLFAGAADPPNKDLLSPAGVATAVPPLNSVLLLAPPNIEEGTSLLVVLGWVAGVEPAVAVLKENPLLPTGAAATAAGVLTLLPTVEAAGVVKNPLLLLGVATLPPKIPLLADPAAPPKILIGSLVVLVVVVAVVVAVR